MKETFEVWVRKHYRADPRYQNAPAVHERVWHFEGGLSVDLNTHLFYKIEGKQYGPIAHKDIPKRFTRGK